VVNQLSFGNIKVFSGIQQALVLALMMITMLALFYVDIDFSYKIEIAVFSFAVIFLATLATAILRQQKESSESQIKQA
jgi:membrane protein implicated in regulation of membrane protease activity